MDDVVQKTAANAEESASSSEELDAQARTMQDVVVDLMLLVGSKGSARSNRPALSCHSNRKRAHRGEVKAIRSEKIIPLDDDLTDF